jgi:hypothetical protein
MATAYEMATGTSGKSASDGTGSALQYTRSWKLVKSSRNEAYDVPTTIGVDIGSQLPGVSGVYCTNLTDNPEGDSLMVRRITATYSSPQNSGRRPNQDLGIAPWLRSAVTTMDAVSESIPAQQYILDPVAAEGTAASKRSLAVQPTGELIDGLTRPDPTIRFQISQFETADPTAKSKYISGLNSLPVIIGGVSFPPRTLILNGISARKQTESYAGVETSGWLVTYSVAYRRNTQRVLVNIDPATGVAIDDEMDDVDIGWDIAVPLRGLNCINLFDDAVNTGYPVDPFALSLLSNEDGVVIGFPQATVGVAVGPIRVLVDGDEWSAFFAGTEFENLAGTIIDADSNTTEKQICRAMVTNPTTAGGFSQKPASSPIPLNPDGSPRGRYRPDGFTDIDDEYYFGGSKVAENAVLAYRRGVNDAFDFALLGVRP